MHSGKEIEACFIALNEIRDRLTNSYMALAEYEKNYSPLLDKMNIAFTRKERFMTRILSETIILNIYKFNEINHHRLPEILKELDSHFHELTNDSLKPLEDLVQTKEYRHYIAHSERRSEKIFTLIDIDPEFYDNHPKMKILAKIVIFYIMCVFENFPDILKNAELTYSLKIKNIKKNKKRDITAFTEYKSHVENTLETINSKLRNEGYSTADISLLSE